MMGFFNSNLSVAADTIPRHIGRITCDAHNCVYHDGDHYCTANRVTIGNLTALSSGDTRCATFEPRGEITRR